MDILVFTSSIFLMVIKISIAAIETECDGFRLDTSCYKVILQDEYTDYRSFSFSSSTSDSFPVVVDGITEYTWNDARTACKDNGTNLAAIPDVRVQIILGYYLKESYPDMKMFIGLRRNSKEDDWKWDGLKEPFEYSNWNIGEPSVKTKACAGVYLNTNDSYWYDIRCSDVIWGLGHTRVGILCQSEITLSTAKTNTGNMGTATPLEMAPCNDHIYVSVIVAQAILIVLLIVLAICMAQKRTPTPQKPIVNGNSLMSPTQCRVSYHRDNKYDGVPPKTAVIIDDENEYATCEQVMQPVYDESNVSMEDDEYMEPIEQPPHASSVYTELNLR
ncbi:uncharacterized protein [Antedon mediterranea]|uniref:uncharacterized protein n=1 Tax=Antedon mediterranea TaxID=105859 RepID=UPI003AF74A77